MDRGDQVEAKARQFAERAGMRWDWIGNNMRQLFLERAKEATTGATDER